MRILLATAVAGPRRRGPRPPADGPPSDSTRSRRTAAGPGSTWDVKLNVLQHGQTPLDGISPAIMIRNLDTGETKTFAATPTGEPGQYAAKVVFPSAGRWDYEVNDGFSQTHTYNADLDRRRRGRRDGGGFPVGWTIAGSTAILLALIAMFVIARRPPRPRVAVPTN